MKDIVYVNGCSFTTGIDLADYIMPGYPAELSFNEYIGLMDSDSLIDHVTEYNDWTTKLFEELVPGELYLNYAGLVNRHMAEIRYTTILEQLIGMPVINKAAPGTDNYSIYVRTCNDVHNLRKQGYNVKKIIFQFTDRSRYSYIKEIKDVVIESGGSGVMYLNYNRLDDELICRSINHASMSHMSYTPAERYLLSHDGPFALEIEMKFRSTLINHFSTLKMYKDAVTAATGIETIMVDSMFTAIELTHVGKDPDVDFSFITNPDPETYIGRTMLSLFPNGMDSMTRMVDRDTKSLAGGLHFNKKVHELFAKHLAEKYFNE